MGGGGGGLSRTDKSLSLENQGGMSGQLMLNIASAEKVGLDQINEDPEKELGHDNSQIIKPDSPGKISENVKQSLLNLNDDSKSEDFGLETREEIH